MIEVLEFTFQSFWHFVGVSILLGSFLSACVQITKIFMITEAMEKGAEE